jgi:hypothetical protein
MKTRKQPRPDLTQAPYQPKLVAQGLHRHLNGSVWQVWECDGSPWENAGWTLDDRTVRTWVLTEGQLPTQNIVARIGTVRDQGTLLVVEKEGHLILPVGAMQALLSAAGLG